MSNKKQTWKLLLVLLVLVTILAVIKFKENKQGDRSFKNHIVAVDSSSVKSIVMTLKGDTKPIELSQESDRWMMNINDQKVQVESGFIAELLGQLVSLKPKRVASTSKNQWPQYEVNDSLATRVVIKSNKKAVADLMIGKFSFDQNARQMTSYVRNYSENEVYAIDGYLSMMVNRDANSFRENAVLIGEPELWKKLVFTYPADSSFSLVKQNNIWMINGLIADSVKVDKYFSQIRMLTDNNFYDDKVIDEKTGNLYSVRIEGDNFSPITINGYMVNNELITKSSVNIGNQFASDNIKDVLFIGSERLLLE